jgi:NAD(P)-dependent dehydrogenase (short-subunit alcohol dehydrogenase family)
MLAIDLRGKTALVLGGSRGIGAGITKALCEAGALTVFTHTGNPAHAERVKALVAFGSARGATGGGIEEASVDSLDFAALESLAGRIVERRGGIDTLVCNVGRNLARPLEETTLADWRAFVDLNLTTAFYGVKAVIPHMVRRKHGRIVLIGSSAVFDGGGGAVDYAAAKAGITGIMKYLSRVYIREGINTNVVHPCVIDTDLVRERYSTPEKWEALASRIPVGRAGKPEDVAGMVAFLASSWGDYICGQEILLDGGRTLFK